VSAGLKTLLAITTSALLIFAVWTIDNQIKSVVFSLVLGIIGTALIFATEFAYSYRKSGLFKLGKVRAWLKVHVVIGIAGPLVIFWHTGLNFYGFGGWLAGLTAVVVASGFFGRYIYRRVKRSFKLDRSKALLAGWRHVHIPLTLALFAGILIHVAGVIYYGKALP